MDGLVATRYATFVGSRKAKPIHVKLCSVVTREATRRGFHARTGDAIGMDAGCRLGAIPGKLTVYSAKPKHGAICGPSLPNFDEATAIAKAVHPYWERCSSFAKLLHGRNPYQVLGESLNEPSEIFVCWAPPNGENAVKGGTNTAYQVAYDWGIPIFNFYFKEDWNNLRSYLERFPVLE